ncbi:MAG: CHAP domain-containing protein [Candidatus Roizmanbacteria bacterium]
MNEPIIKESLIYTITAIIVVIIFVSSFSLAHAEASSNDTTIQTGLLSRLINVLIRVDNAPVRQQIMKKYITSSQDKPTPYPTFSVILKTPEFGRQLVTTFAEEIQAKCKADDIAGRVTRENVSCLRKISLPIDAKLQRIAINEMSLSAQDHETLQCVHFVNAMSIISTGVYPQRDGLAIGNAKDYAVRVPDNFVYIKNIKDVFPKLGDLVIFDSGEFGHIAYVLRIFDANTFQVAESNFDAKGTVDTHRIVAKDDPSLIGWLRFDPNLKISSNTN